jgi:hypothetical protein
VGLSYNDLSCAPTCHLTMQIILLQGPDVHDDIGVVFLECVDVGHGGRERYASPIKILEVRLPYMRPTQLTPPQRFGKRVVKPAHTHSILETEVVSLLFEVRLSGIINVDQAMLGLDGIRGLDERPTTTAGVSVDTDRDLIHAQHLHVLVLVRPFLYIVIIVLNPGY